MVSEAIKNNLKELESMLIKHKMINIKALRTTSASFFTLMADNQLLCKSHLIPVLMSALKKVPDDVVYEQKEPEEVIRIYVSKEEEDWMKELNEYLDKIDDLKVQMNKINDLWIEKEKKTHGED